MVGFRDASGGGRTLFTSSPGSFSTMVDFERRSRGGAGILGFWISFSILSITSPAKRVRTCEASQNCAGSFSTMVENSWDSRGDELQVKYYSRFQIVFRGDELYPGAC